MIRVSANTDAAQLLSTCKLVWKLHYSLGERILNHDATVTYIQNLRRIYIELHLIMKLQFWRAGECGVLLHCYYSQVNSDTKLRLMVKLQFWSSGECGVPLRNYYSQVPADTKLHLMVKLQFSRSGECRVPLLAITLRSTLTLNFI